MLTQIWFPGISLLTVTDNQYIVPNVSDIIADCSHPPISSQERTIPGHFHFTHSKIMVSTYLSTFLFMADTSIFEQIIVEPVLILFLTVELTRKTAQTLLLGI